MTEDCKSKVACAVRTTSAVGWIKRSGSTDLSRKAVPVRLTGCSAKNDFIMKELKNPPNWQRTT
jgi:hypothetical protein